MKRQLQTSLCLLTDYILTIIEVIIALLYAHTRALVYLA